MKKGLRLTSILSLLTMLILLGVRWAERSDRLNLIRVRVDNSGLADSVEIAEILRPYFGNSLLKLDTDSMELELLSVAGVDSVSVKIHYPDEIVVSLLTREPAAILAYSSGRFVPVTLHGDPLPAHWGNDNLPVISIEEEPELEVIVAALDLLIKRALIHSVSIQVTNREIVITQNGIRVILDPGQTTENWLRWRSISTMIKDGTIEVDLRFHDQVVLRQRLRSTEEAES